MKQIEMKYQKIRKTHHLQSALFGLGNPQLSSTADTNPEEYHNHGRVSLIC